MSSLTSEQLQLLLRVNPLTAVPQASNIGCLIVLGLIIWFTSFFSSGILKHSCSGAQTSSAPVTAHAVQSKALVDEANEQMSHTVKALFQGSLREWLFPTGDVKVLTAKYERRKEEKGKAERDFY